MRRLYSFILTLLFVQFAYAQWPANYGGVMLQGFYWDSYDDTKWTNLTSQVDEISKYFDVVWVPNSGNCGSAGTGYIPLYWFNHNSNWGRQKTLINMIKAFNAKGTKVIEDVVINHKGVLGANESWVDFANESVKGPTTGNTYTVTWSPADICQNDDGGYTNTVGASAEMIAKNGGWQCTGSNDTGDDFSGVRDLDHTSANVQNNIKQYLDFLIKELGYSGFRLDMVKGYSPYYTKIYNEHAKPEFCVGEYWDGSTSKLIDWINGTGKTSAVFDFALKYAIRDVFGGGNWSWLKDNKGLATSYDYSRYSVTFIDNHDTYENQDRLSKNVLAANACILALPGTPCIFYKHWTRYPIAIGNMILARKAAGITNQSWVKEDYTPEGGYVMKVQGTKGEVLYICGFPTFDTTGYKLIASGENFAYFVNEGLTVEGLVEGSDDDDTEQKKVTVYVEATKAPHLYVWTSAGTRLNGDWPGEVMEESEEIGDKTFWRQTFAVAPINVIFNNGEGVQTADIGGVAHDSYFTFDETNSDMKTNFTNITDQYYSPDPVELPACVEEIPGHIYVYFKSNKDYDQPYVWAWDKENNWCKNEWPGDKMTHVGDDGNGHNIYLWDLGAIPADGSMPTGILFSNKGSDTLKTSDFSFKNGGYYDVYGLIGQITTGIKTPQIITTDTQSSVFYNLQGQRVSSSYKGIVIKDGKKYYNH